MPTLLPIFVDLERRPVLLVGGGTVAAAKLVQLRAAGADVRVVSPVVHAEIVQSGVDVELRSFEPSDLDAVWLVVAAAPPGVNRDVAAAAEGRRLFVNAVDDPSNASAFLGGVVRRGGVTIAVSTNGEAPGLAGLLREALEALLPADLGDWLQRAREARTVWRRDRVPMNQRRPLLLRALNRLYEGRSGFDDSERDARRVPSGSTRAGRGPGSVREVTDARLGHVAIVGAGPGDPGLLTRTALARLRAADLVLYDALVDERVLRLARHAQRFFVGKRAGRHALGQAEVHALMIRAARKGRRVVRLKGGDPFVFGRGGEEALALARADVSFEVVPGVTSAVAGPALAGIPLTHRGVASAFLVVSGHDERTFDDQVRGVTPTGVTLVVMMGLARRAAWAGRLVDRGWPDTTPVAVIADASTPRQHIRRGTLADLAGDQSVVGGGPVLIVVGEVAALDVSSAHGEESWHPAAAGQRG